MQMGEKAQAFLAKNPAKLGTIANVTFYEHPDLGDEVPMFFIDEQGRLRRSVHWDMESAQDAAFNSFF